jgi:hypothetical protein
VSPQILDVMACLVGGKSGDAFRRGLLQVDLDDEAAEKIGLNIRGIADMKTHALKIVDAVSALETSARIDTAVAALHQHAENPGQVGRMGIEFDNPIKQLEMEFDEGVEEPLEFVMSNQTVQIINTKLWNDESGARDSDGAEEAKTQRKIVTSIYMQNLRLTKNSDAVFSIAGSFIAMKLAKLELVHTLHQVQVIDNDKDAKAFFEVKRAVGEFVRLSRRLHSEDTCKECVQAVEKMRELCHTSRNQLLMSHLRCADVIIYVLMLDVHTSNFHLVVHALFAFISEFVNDCPLNQVNRSSTLSAKSTSVPIKLLYVRCW